MKNKLKYFLCILKKNFRDKRTKLFCIIYCLFGILICDLLLYNNHYSEKYYPSEGNISVYTNENNISLSSEYLPINIIIDSQQGILDLPDDGSKKDKCYKKNFSNYINCQGKSTPILYLPCKSKFADTHLFLSTARILI